VTVVEGWRALGQSPPISAPSPQPGAPSENGDRQQGSTIILELGAAVEDRHRLVGLTVDEVTDMLAAGAVMLEDRQGLAGIDPTLVRAVGRRPEGEVFVVLDLAALLGPILMTRSEQ
jgi:chemotaxis signal transduction protein